MKKLTLNILTLAAIVGIMPMSTSPIDTIKDSITIRVSNEQDRSEKLKDHNLLCFYVRIKNGTGVPIELPKYAVSSPILASENTLTAVMGYTPEKVGKAMTKFILGTGIQIAPSLAIRKFRDIAPFRWNHLITILSNLSAITSPLTGAAWAITSYLKHRPIQLMLQEYLERKTTTIKINGEAGFYIYVDLDQYQRSIGKNITIKLHKNDTDQVILFDINTTDVLQAQTA